jgi:hypothetical protein
MCGGAVMLALVEHELRKGRWHKCGEEVKSENLPGLNYIRLKLKIPQNVGERRINRQMKRARELLHLLRVTEIIFKDNFPYKSEFSGEFKIPSSEMLYKSKAAEILKTAAKEKNRVLICVKRLDNTAMGEIIELCRDFRYITVDARADVFECISDAALRFGVSPSPLRRDRAVSADAAVFFDAPQRPIVLSVTCAALFVNENSKSSVYGGKAISNVAFRLPAKIDSRLPEGYPKLCLASAMISRGSAAARDIRVISVK